MTVSEKALFDLVFYGGGFLAFVIYIAWKALRSWKPYLPFIDLVSYTLGGLSLAVIFWNGTISFTQSYPEQLTASGLTNVREPFRPIYDQIRSRRDEVCEKKPETIDCYALRQFVRSAYAELNGEFFLVRVPATLPPDSPAETARLISAYNAAFDIVPRPIDAMAEAVRKLGGVTAIALLFAWMLGVHRRWIVFNQARR